MREIWTDEKRVVNTGSTLRRAAETKEDHHHHHHHHRGDEAHIHTTYGPPISQNPETA
jgi:hypothetical protein